MRTGMLSALLGAWLAACGVAGGPAPAAPVEPARIPEAAPPCTGVRVEAPEVTLTCESETSFWAGSCSGKMVLAVHNCRGTSIEIRELVMTDVEGDKQTVWTFEPDTLVEHEGTWTFERVLLVEGEYELMLTYGLDEMSTIVDWVGLTVRNPALEEARESCEECNGDFGAHGMLGIVGCLCRTADAGRPCDDGNDCEGKCISGDTGFTCSEFTTVFGCHSYLPKGWSHETHTPPVKVPHICVD